MDISTIGSINTYLKSLELKTKWKVKQETGKSDKDKDKSISEWEKAAKDMEEQTEKDRERTRLNSIYMKLTRGKKLTEEERSYLREKDPVSYEKSKSIDRERKDYERKLKQCRTKEDVRRLKLSKLSSSLSTVNAVKNDPNISTSMKLKVATMEKSRIAAFEEEERKFFRSGDFGRLPENAAEDRENRRVVREFKRTLEELWEEIFKDMDGIDDGELGIYDKDSVDREPEAAMPDTDTDAAAPEKEKAEQAAARAAAEQAYGPKEPEMTAESRGRVLCKKA